jgi:asparagine synthase (glutamine-hydrolysing)
VVSTASRVADPVLDATLEAMIRAGWSVRVEIRGLRVMTAPGFHWPVAQIHRSHVLIGEWRGRGAHPSALVGRSRSGAALGRDLMREGWGAYLLAWLDDAGGLNVIRDPSGALDAVWWHREGVTLVADGLPPVLDPVLPAALAIDWPRLADILATPALVTDRVPLLGLETVGPGDWVRTATEGCREAIWRPADHARRRVDETAAALVGVVDAAVDGLMRSRRKVVAEVSGGLDSAIVAGVLTATGHASKASFVTYFGEDREGDERVYAEAAAKTGGFDLSLVPKPVEALTPEDFAPLGQGLRPALQGVDVAYDREATRRLAAIDAEGLVTGQGGDSVFFHAPDPRVAADRFRRIGVRGLDPVYWAAVGRWTRRSAWTVGRLAISRSRAEARCDHPWLQDLDDLPPAKRGQIERLVNNQVFWTDCLRARQAPLLNPLLSQPVVEHCLGVPTDRLTLGPRDRGLARLAFADRLPEEIRERRSKGDLSGFYGRLTRASLPALQALLLDGCLVQAGVLDRVRLEIDLDDQRLLWSEGANQPLLAAVLEVWARHWSGRIADRRAEIASEPGQNSLVEVADIGRAGEGVALAEIVEPGGLAVEAVEGAEQGAVARPVQIGLDQQHRGEQGRRVVERAQGDIAVGVVGEDPDSGLAGLRPADRGADGDAFVDGRPVE